MLAKSLQTALVLAAQLAHRKREELDARHMLRIIANIDYGRRLLLASGADMPTLITMLEAMLDP